MLASPDYLERRHLKKCIDFIQIHWALAAVAIVFCRPVERPVYRTLKMPSLIRKTTEVTA